MPPDIDPKSLPIGAMIQENGSSYIISKTDKKKTWKKLPKYEEYETHWNGGRFFLVRVLSDTKVEVYKNLSYEEKYEKFAPIWKFYKEIECKKVFIGKSPRTKQTEYSGGYGKKFDGNTILLQLDKHHYMIIVDKLHKFTTKDEIVEYVSPVGNSDVPYMYAIGDKYTYLWLEKVYALNEDVVNKKLPYDQYYKNRDEGIDTWKKMR